ncbi:S1/P1 nuclease [Ceratobasidium sp. AG-Ba]|nr:S1/P1 nuclease [Ceratobasidium sp. AG-Ba]
MHFLSLALLCAVQAATPVWGWGEEGHKITGTIAQIHLLPSAQQAICKILPGEFKCHLANIAVWADTVKRNPKWRWSSELHYVNPEGDNPPEDCTYGEKGWKNPTENILPEIVNNTGHLFSKTITTQDIALRFLTHYLGDLHQPFHLTGRARGGNQVRVRYQGKSTNLHSAWDGDLIRRRIRTLNNYTSPLPTAPTLPLPPPILAWNKRIEAALQGSNYDPLVRWVVSEGIHGWWANELEEWVKCPQLELQASPEQAVMNGPPFEDPPNLPVCPYAWSVASHKLLCDFLWSPDFDESDDSDPVELEKPEYAGRIRDMKIVEKQLALGGMRLAAVVNAVFGSEEDKRAFGIWPKVL